MRLKPIRLAALADRFELSTRLDEGILVSPWLQRDRVVGPAGLRNVVIFPPQCIGPTLPTKQTPCLNPPLYSITSGPQQTFDVDLQICYLGHYFA